MSQRLRSNSGFFRKYKRWTSADVDKLLYLLVGGLSTFAFYHYQRTYEVSNIPQRKQAEHRWYESYLKLTNSKVPQSREYPINLDRKVLEHNYAQFIIDSTLHQIKSVINVALAPENCGKSTVLINAANIIVNNLKSKNEKINEQINENIYINQNCLKRFKNSNIFILYLNLEQGMKEAIRETFKIQSKNELEALTLLNMCLTYHINNNECILLLLDSPNNFHLQSDQNSNEIQIKFNMILKSLIDSGNGYIFCLTNEKGSNIFKINQNIQNNLQNRLNIFQDDRFFLNKNEKLALIDAVIKYDGTKQNIVLNGDTSKIANKVNVEVNQLYELMCEDDCIKEGIIGDSLAYINETFSIC